MHSYKEIVEMILNWMFLIIAVLMIFFILLQEGKGGGLAPLGGTKAAGVVGVTNPIRRFTGYLAAIFFLIAIVLGIMNRPETSNFKGEQDKKLQASTSSTGGSTPATDAAKAPEPPKAEVKTTEAGKPGETPKATEAVKPTEAPKTTELKPGEKAVEPAKTEPAKTDALKTEPAKTEPAPAKVEPAKTEPAKTEPAKVEATPAEANKPAPDAKAPEKTEKTDTKTDEKK